MKNNKQNKSVRKSLKGKYGKVGAPPKATKFPRGAFTMEALFNMNKNQCELSLRNKVDARLEDGSLIQLKSRKQAGGKVGRPKAVFVLKDNFDASKHEKADVKAKTPKAKVTKTRTVVTVTAEATVTPTTPPVPEASVIPATSAPAAVEQPVSVPTATVETVVSDVVEQPVISAPVNEPVTA